MARNLQFSASYLPGEDRLLLRGTFPDGTEIQLLLTRRLIRGLLDGLDKISEHMVRGDVAAPEVKQQVASFTREVAVGQADFSQRYEKGEPHPLMAEAPRLAKEISLTAKSGDRIAVAIGIEGGQRLNFTLPSNGVWSLGHLLAKQAERAEWALGPVKPALQPAATGRLN